MDFFNNYFKFFITSNLLIRLINLITLMLDFKFGAILKISGLYVFFVLFVIARIKKFKISKMCCHGLIALISYMNLFITI